MDRRTFLAGAASMPFAPTAVAAARRKVPPRVTRARMVGWHEMVADGGPRLTGSRAHHNYVEFLARQLERRRLQVQRDHLRFNRWIPKTWNLTVNGNAIPLGFYFPYSGVTGPAGVTAPLVYVGTSPAALWSAAKDKIAVVDVLDPPLPASTLFTQLGHSPADAEPPPATIFIPPVSDTLIGPDLSAAKAAGVKGVICVRNAISDALAADQYSPFTTPYYDCPAVWALPSAAQRVRELATQGATATLTMDATLTQGAPTDTLYTILPGSDPHEAIVINTHTDGPNVPEECGGLGMLAIADHYRRIPRRQRRRTLIFAFVTGHFQLPQFTAPGGSMAASTWMAAHPDLLTGPRYKTVAALTVEHLGCREWQEAADHSGYGPTGLNEPGYCYTTTDTMRDVWLASAGGTKNTRTFACAPTGIYLGEGAPFYKAGIPTMSLIPGPTYLTAAPKDGSFGKLSFDLVMGQVRTFIHAIDRLNQIDATAFGTPSGLA